MSVAKRDRGKDPEQVDPANDDEGKADEDQQRFRATNQALKWAKNSISDTKLYLYAKTGQIQESKDSDDVVEACAKLDTFREQIESLLLNAENWTQSMLQTWHFQTSFVDSLNEGSSVILAFDRSTPPAQPPSDEQKSADADPSNPIPSDPNQNRNQENVNANQNINQESQQNQESVDLSSSAPSARHSHFAQILQGIANELLSSQQASEGRYGHANKLLVVPLRNILSHEIAHAMDMKKKYILTKRQFDNCCTTITNLQTKLHEIDHPPEETADEAASKGALMGKLKMGFGKLMASAPTRDDVEAKLIEAREELPRHIKVFEKDRQQLLEAIDVIDFKLNDEVVYYVQQFASFVKENLHGDSHEFVGQSEIGQGIQGAVGMARRTVSMEEKEAAAVLEAVLPVQEIEIEVVREVDEAKAKESEFVAEMQMDAMMNDGVMENLDVVDLGSPELQHQADDAEKEVELGGGDEVMHGVET